MQSNQLIKNLLRLGKRERAIARALHIARGKVSAVAREMKASRLAPEKPGLLDTHRAAITALLQKTNMTTRKVHAYLLNQGVAVSYSTVQRTIQKIQKDQMDKTGPEDAGKAVVGIIFLGRFYKDGQKMKVWVFYMTLSFSRYSYFRAITDYSAIWFLDSHVKAFRFFSRVPVEIMADADLLEDLASAPDETRAIQHYPALLSYYKTALLLREPAGTKKTPLPSEGKLLKDYLWHGSLHRNYARMVKELDQYTHVSNLLTLPGATVSPLRQFIQREKKALQPLPDHAYPISPCIRRKVNRRGYVIYQYNYYSVPYGFINKTVVLQVIDTSLHILLAGSVIATHSKSTSKGLYIRLEGHHRPTSAQSPIEKTLASRTKDIGHYAYLLMLQMKRERPSHWHRTVRKLVSLQNQYSTDVLNCACRQALAAKTISYKAVKKNCTHI